MSARELGIAEIIYAAHGYAPDGKTENASGEPYGEWSKAVKAAHDLTAAGYCILGPDEVDPVTVERCAEIADKRAAMAGAVSHEAARALLEALPDAIRALASGGKQ